MLAGMEKVHNLRGSGKLLGGNLPYPRRTVRQEHDIPAAMVALLVRQRSQQGAERFRVLQRGDISAGENVRVFAVFILSRFVDHSDLALAVPTRQVPRAAVLLPAVAQRNKHAIHADVQAPPRFSFGFGQTVMVMGRHVLLLLSAQRGTDRKGNAFHRVGAYGHVGEPFQYVCRLRERQQSAQIRGL